MQHWHASVKGRSHGIIKRLCRAGAITVHPRHNLSACTCFAWPRNFGPPWQARPGIRRPGAFAHPPVGHHRRCPMMLVMLDDAGVDWCGPWSWGAFAVSKASTGQSRCTYPQAQRGPRLLGVPPPRAAAMVSAGTTANVPVTQATHMCIHSRQHCFCRAPCARLTRHPPSECGCNHTGAQV